MTTNPSPAKRNHSATEQIRELEVGDCYTQAEIVSSLPEGNEARKRLRNKIRPLMSRAAKATGHEYSTTTIMQPAFQEHMYVAVAVWRTG